MNNINCWFLLEGDDDERYVNYIIKPLLKEKNIYVKKPLKYSNIAKENCKKFLKTIKKMKNSTYICLGDINNKPCITYKKNEIIKKFGKGIDKTKIFIIVKKIEGWYLAGIKDEDLIKLGIKNPTHTNNINKEQFYSFKPYDKSEIQYKTEMLERYDMNIAKKKNLSLKYFLEKNSL